MKTITLEEAKQLAAERGYALQAVESTPVTWVLSCRHCTRQAGVGIPEVVSLFLTVLVPCVCKGN